MLLDLQYRLSAFYFARIGSDLPMDFLLPSVSLQAAPQADRLLDR